MNRPLWLDIVVDFICYLFIVVLFALLMGGFGQAQQIYVVPMVPNAVVVVTNAQPLLGPGGYAHSADIQWAFYNDVGRIMDPEDAADPDKWGTWDETILHANETTGFYLCSVNIPWFSLQILSTVPLTVATYNNVDTPGCP